MPTLKVQRVIWISEGALQYLPQRGTNSGAQTLGTGKIWKGMSQINSGCLRKTVSTSFKAGLLRTLALGFIISVCNV